MVWRSFPMWSTALAVLFLATPSQALYDELAFTPMVEDPSDNLGFLDLLTISVAETGADELVFRYEVDTALPAQASISQALFFTLDGTVWSTGITATGAPGGNGNFDVPSAKSCILDGGFGYCVIDYAELDVAVGDTLSVPYAISYAGSAQDYGPALGGFVPNGFLGEVGSDYTLVGCTKVDPVACGGGGSAGRVFGNLTGTTVSLAFTNATDANHVYNLTGPTGPVDLVYAINGTGKVTVVVQDGSQEVVFNQTFTAPANATLRLQDAVAGNWSYNLTFAAFNGSLQLALEVPEPTRPGTSSTTSTAPRSSTSTSPSNATGNETFTATDSADTPMAAPMLVATALVAAAMVLRRRR